MLMPSGSQPLGFSTSSKSYQRPFSVTVRGRHHRPQCPGIAIRILCHVGCSPMLSALYVSAYSSLGFALTFWGSICDSACCSGLGHGSFPGEAGASSSQFSMSIVTSPASGLCSSSSSPALLLFLVPPARKGSATERHMHPSAPTHQQAIGVSL